MPSNDIVRVTEPIEVTPDEDGILIRIVSGQSVFLFHASRHKVRNTNMAVRALLDKIDRCDGRVEPFIHKAARDRAANHS